MLALRGDMSMSKDMQDRWWAKVGFATNIFRKVGRRENVQEHAIFNENIYGFP